MEDIYIWNVRDRFEIRVVGADHRKHRECVGENSRRDSQFYNVVALMMTRPINENLQVPGDYHEWISGGIYETTLQSR